jgi:alkanesulfonate monooxygenase SsuD/methylene tetrahydromethanopterin reductase-like flavin-dependent oxidoreductase (luciferase family)
MWSDNISPYQGKYNHPEYPLYSPQSVQQPPSPIIIGGGGEWKTLRLVAQNVDACNFLSFFANSEQGRYKLAVLRGIVKS